MEGAIGWYLSRPTDLTNREKLLLRDAISAAYRGLFGLAAQAIYDMGEPEAQWASSVEDAAVDGITRESLRRALTALESSPVQSPAVFR
ncbi:hypothetical protein [Azospirillum sp. Sh1]|uniref:hypothetical protein n=1 Tax=Azospirillum sp. Sh1 TaxID=2607285 RepID=UPI0011F02E24|nr:hypothetical protein [Azospirillum sp. Sh1]KAA0570134.1 hypothetical protein FZ029_31600 [Azospirillum sp. Sh1]